jgi:hypothetical protein
MDFCITSINIDQPFRYLLPSDEQFTFQLPVRETDRWMDVDKVNDSTPSPHIEMESPLGSVVGKQMIVYCTILQAT